MRVKTCKRGHSWAPSDPATARAYKDRGVTRYSCRECARVTNREYARRVASQYPPRGRLVPSWLFVAEVEALRDAHTPEKDIAMALGMRWDTYRRARRANALETA